MNQIFIFIGNLDKMDIAQARQILHEMTASSALLRHARTVALVMRALARHFGAEEKTFA